jgi:NADH:ubiquinone reductase (H+-translocating)
VDRELGRAVIMHRVVIVGCGFAGLFAANALRRAEVEVVVVDRTNHHLFQALLYQVATGVLSECDIAPPIRDVLRQHRNTRVLIGEVVDIDVAGRTLTIDTPGQTTTLPYDSLILATGASQSYFGHDEYARDAPGLKTIDDALELRGRIFGAFEMAELEADDAARLPWLTFAVVGAGPTGVELAGQIAELSRRALRANFRRFDPASARIVLLDAVDTVLPSYPQRLRRRAQRDLEGLGSSCASALGSSASTRQAWTSRAAASRPAPRSGRQACRPCRSGGCSPTARRPPSTARAAWRWRPTVRCPGTRRCSSSEI